MLEYESIESYDINRFEFLISFKCQTGCTKKPSKVVSIEIFLSIFGKKLLITDFHLSTNKKTIFGIGKWILKVPCNNGILKVFFITFFVIVLGGTTLLTSTKIVTSCWLKYN